MTKRKFKILSWTWGLPMTLIGYAVAVVLRWLDYRPHQWGGSTYFQVGRHWGGVSFGPITVVDNNTDDYILNHEFGHAIQNCYWGLLFPFVIAIPSFIRYWFREAVVYFGIRELCELPGYYTIWFEKQASNLGQKYIEKW